MSWLKIGSDGSKFVPNRSKRRRFIVRSLLIMRLGFINQVFTEFGCREQILPAPLISLKQSLTVVNLKNSLRSILYNRHGQTATRGPHAAAARQFFFAFLEPFFSFLKTKFWPNFLLRSSNFSLICIKMVIIWSVTKKIFGFAEIQIVLNR